MFFYLLSHRETKRKANETGRENSDFQGFCDNIRKKGTKIIKNQTQIIHAQLLLKDLCRFLF
jgi:hypothetical protein